MKKKIHLSKLGLIAYWALLPWYLSASAQDPYTGIWEGDFMDQFKTVILLEQQDNTDFAGKILMYSGETRIQDDVLNEIRIENEGISFSIEAKETSFEGRFNGDHKTFSGHFIFPDKSRHPLSMSKYDKDSQAVEKESPPLKERLRQSFPVEELKSDLRELMDQLKRYHPRLYSHTSEAEFESQVTEILGSLDTDLDMEKFYLRTAPLVAAVKCSHTGIRMPPEYQEAIQDQELFFPLRLYFQDMRAYCLDAPAYPDLELEAGSEIKEINGRPMEELIRIILELIPAEGENKSRKYQVLNSEFHSYYHMLDPAGQFSVEVSHAGNTESIVLAGCPFFHVGQPGPHKLEARPYSFRMHDHPEAGLLKVSSFGIMDLEAYFAFLDSSFSVMRDYSVQHLVLDLRDNQGGHPIFAAQLFSYLTDTSFTYFQRNPEIADFEPLYSPMEPNPLSFGGHIYVLVNGNCLSTTGHLLSLIRFHTGARFIGEDPGSSLLCNDYSIQVKLSSTGLEVNIPRTTFRTAVSGFSPEGDFPLDLEVRPTAQDLLDGKDPCASSAYELIRRSAGP